MSTSRHRRKLIIAGAVLIAVTVAVILAWRTAQVQIAYHEWRMLNAWHETVDHPDVNVHGMTTFTLGDSWDRYIRHRKALVRLGKLVEKQYRFHNILYPGTEAQHLLHKMLAGRCPPNLDWGAPSPESPEPLTITIWFDAELLETWDAFIAQHDVHDYAERFMKSE